MQQEFTTKARKKEFDSLFKEKIVPFLNDFGFTRCTTTSKAMFKDLGNGLSVFIFFEFKTFGSGFYDINITYFDTEIGNVHDGQYLAMAQIRRPTIKGNSMGEMNSSVDLWISKIQSEIIPFIESHSTHKAILKSNHFYMPYGKENQFKELLIRKSQDG